MSRFAIKRALIAGAACLLFATSLQAQLRYETVHTFSGSRGRPFGSLTEGPGGRLFGTTVAGGQFGKGSIFVSDGSGDAVTLHDFDGADGEAPRGTLLLARDGSFYGTTSFGGDGSGTIFRITPEGSFSTLVKFDGLNGAFPQSGLMQDADGTFYGTTLGGGEVGSGTVFQLSEDGSTLITVLSFDGLDGGFPYGGVIRASDGHLYGTTERGGEHNVGTIFQIASTGEFSIIASFDGTNGAWPRSALVEASDLNFYGTTVQGGAGGRGTMFQLMPGGALSAVLAFTGAEGATPLGDLHELTDGLYGTTQEGGANGFGTVFRWNPKDSAFGFASFDGSNGSFPASGVIQASTGAIYGTTEHGGPGEYGTIFELGADLTPNTILSFTGSTGADPSGHLTKAGDGNFYGTTMSGGASGYGTAFRLTPDGILTTIASFDGINGAFPSGGLMEASDGDLYGTTEGGGLTGDGTAFRLSREGTLTSIASFDFSASGAVPLGGLIEASDGDLYGTTLFGANGAFGTVFRLARGGGLSTLVTFDDLNGSFPTSGVMQAPSGDLYGTTESGGETGLGTIFKLTFDGTDWIFSTVVMFNDADGSVPAARLALASDGSLYGTTTYGGATGDGTVFKLAPGDVFGSVASFDGLNGSFPYQQGLVEGRDGRLYGTTTYGGDSGTGVLYRLSGDAITPVYSFDGITSANPNTTLIDAGDAVYGTASAPQGGILYRISMERLAAALDASAAPATYGGATSLSATLTSAAGPIAGADIAFTIDDVPAGVAVTDESGTATLSNVSVAGLEPGSRAVVATFEGNEAYQGAHAMAVLLISPPPPGLDGLVAAYGFNEGVGTIAADASGRGHTGVISGAAYVGGGRFGGALKFDGNNDWVTVADASDLDFNTGMTLEAWVKPAALAGWNTIVMKESGSGLAYALYANDEAPQPAGYARVGGYDRSVAGPGPLPLNVWTHVALTYDNAALTLYLNGSQVNRQALTGPIQMTKGVLRIGGNSVWDEFFNGQIDEVRLYGRALGGAEIQRDMTMPIAHETTAPMVAITSPSDGSTLAGIPSVTVSATDDMAIATVQLQVDGVDVAPILATAPYTFPLNLANGKHVVKAIARDTAGNMSTSLPVTVTIANETVADYRFDEGTGTAVVDGSGRANTGTISGGVSRVIDAQRGKVLAFNGSSGMVTVRDAASLDLSSAMTLEAWIKPSSVTQGWRTVVLKEMEGGLTYSLYSTNEIARPAAYVHIPPATADYEVSGPKRLTAGVWTHLAMTYDGATLRLFVNGVEVESRAQSGNVTVSAGALRIGGNSVWGEWFAGRMDNVRVYGVAVSQAQIKADMGQ